ncbi:MAG: cob(I)yrinic acid a,c-diamide adenosyltransferase [Candidatus Omnitrophica bacterium]|nr:cob(I)yrinic acid a,c-diamide adenosyltransferase [Candidatus Omnitrophota bacterium]
MKKPKTFYSTQGDQGFTEIGGGVRVPKDALQVEACGAVHELNSLLGLAISLGVSPELIPILLQIQSDLFYLSEELSYTSNPEKNQKIATIESRHVKALEKHIESLTEALDSLEGRIVPGGSLPASVLHLARSVCWRVERRAVSLLRQWEEDSRYVLKYLNRLSDLMFIMARFQNRQDGLSETEWPGKGRM